MMLVLRCMGRVLFFIFILFPFLFGNNAFSQCSTTIASFPYLQDFEATNGGWVSGGSASSWAWGTPNKTIINSAGGGVKCWISGGLTGNSYNDGEASWVESPCFNFSTLANPQITAKIFWETEKQFDGAGFEYSLNAGASWTTLGNASSNSNCKGVNWYNFNAVKYLGNTPGWSGSIQPTIGACQGGMGSGGWVTAKHTLIALAGKPSVKFRFTFGAGTQCNAYNGFAFDDFKIEEIPPNPSAFTYECTSSNTANFSTVSKICQTLLVWDFGDPASGISNTSILEQPSHTFSAPGSYVVKLTTAINSGTPTSTTQNITINNVSTSVTTPVLCNGGTGSALATSSAAGVFTYSWNSTPVQNTSFLSNVPAGNYTVTVKAAKTCDASASVTITEPTAINVSISSTNASCSASDGTVTSIVSGGTGNYTYLWSNGETTANLSNVAASASTSYTLTVKDANNCTKVSNSVVVSQNNSNIQINPTITPAICTASNGSISLVVSGGTAPYTYLWSNGSTASGLSNLLPADYSVTIKDANGCEKLFSNLVVTSSTSTILITPTTQPANCNQTNGSINLTVTGGTAPYTYLWNNGATTKNITSLAAGPYDVTVKDANGCEDTKNFVVAQAGSTLAISVTPQMSSCNQINGSISLTVTGGTAPYTYLWSNGATTKNITGLSAGTYGVTVKDANGCTAIESGIVITQASANILIDATPLPSKCVTNNGSISTSVSGGISPYSYDWSNGATTSNLINIAPGTYSINVTDANGCTGSLNNIEVRQVEINLNVNLGDDKNICPGQRLILNPGNFTSYKWQDNSTSSTYSVISAGEYYVKVIDNFGCTGSDTINITSNCSGSVYFPNAFTPNGDNLNDVFGIIGDLSGIRDYELIIYGRWGQKIFSSKNPLEKWDGTYKGKALTSQTCVWVASFTINNRLPQIEKGTITIIR